MIPTLRQTLTTFIKATLCRSVKFVVRSKYVAFRVASHSVADFTNIDRSPARTTRRSKTFGKFLTALLITAVAVVTDKVRPLNPDSFIATIDIHAHRLALTTLLIDAGLRIPLTIFR